MTRVGVVKQTLPNVLIIFKFFFAAALNTFPLFSKPRKKLKTTLNRHFHIHET